MSIFAVCWRVWCLTWNKFSQPPIFPEPLESRRRPCSPVVGVQETPNHQHYDDNETEITNQVGLKLAQLFWCSNVISNYWNVGKCCMTFWQSHATAIKRSWTARATNHRLQLLHTNWNKRISFFAKGMQCQSSSVPPMTIGKNPEMVFVGQSILAISTIIRRDGDEDED